jgi:dienelactone hydrolase
MQMKLLRVLPFIVMNLIAAPVYAQASQAWAKAIVYAPGSSTPQAIDELKTDKKYPVVLFMHECNGLANQSNDSHAWGKLFASEGFLVVMPDSLARSDREPSCDPAARRYGLFPAVHAMRLEEIRFASSEIRKQPWFDGKNLLLMGYSEGAVATVRTRLPGFRGVIASSLTCSNAKNPAFDGVFVTPETPVLTLSHERDPVYTEEHLKGSCGQKAAGRANAEHVGLPGNGHGTFHSDSAKQAVTRFAKQVVQPQ